MTLSPDEETQIGALTTKSYYYLVYTSRGIGQEHELYSSPPTPNANESREARGNLSQLPLDVINNILLFLDMRSLSLFRATCFAHWHVVDCLPEYRRLADHALLNIQAKRAARGVYDDIATRQLYRAFTSAGCVRCGNFAPFLFLLTVERCCKECMWLGESFETASAPNLAHKLGLDLNLMHRRLRLAESCLMTGGHHVSVAAAKQLRREESAAAGREEHVGTSQHQNCRTCTLSWSASRWTVGLRTVVDGRDDMIVPFPSMDLRSPNHDVETGLWCRGCSQIACATAGSQARDIHMAPNLKDERDVAARRYIMASLRSYRRREILEHFKECQGAKAEWDWFVQARALGACTP